MLWSQLKLLLTLPQTGNASRGWRREADKEQLGWGGSALLSSSPL